MSDDLAARLANALSSREDVVFAYLFGSQAKGRTHPRSDVDVAVWLREPYDRASFAQVLQVTGAATDALRRSDVDVVVLNEAPLPLAFEALRSGRLLFSKDEATRVQAESLLMRRYHDRAHYRDRYLAQVGERFAERGFS